MSSEEGDNPSEDETQEISSISLGSSNTSMRNIDEIVRGCAEHGTFRLREQG